MSENMEMSSESISKKSKTKSSPTKRRRRKALYTPKKKTSSAAANKKRKASGTSVNEQESKSRAKKSKKTKQEETTENDNNKNINVKEQKQELKEEQPDESKSKKKSRLSKGAIGSSSDSGILLEKGHILFAYRPKVEHESAHDWNDVQKLYMVLEPHESTAPMNRLIVIANKKLPKPGETRTRDYGIVVAVSSNIKDVTEGLETKEYETKTRGTRHLAGARIAAEGLYEIIKTHKGHTHLAYVIEQPPAEKFGEAQKAFNIAPEEEFVMQIRNPRQLTGARSDRIGLSDRGKGAEFPSELIDKYFEGKTKELRWAPAVPELLNYEHAELLLVGAHDHISEHLGELGAELEREAQQEEQKLEKLSHPDAIVYKEFAIPHNADHPHAPLTQGKLV